MNQAALHACTCSWRKNVMVVAFYRHTIHVFMLTNQFHDTTLSSMGIALGWTPLYCVSSMAWNYGLRRHVTRSSD